MSRPITLVVDDEPVVRRLVCMLLEGHGYQTLAAADGEEALELSRSHIGEIHLLVSDLVMPRLSGDQLAAIIRKERPETRILLMTGTLPEHPADLEHLTPAILEKPFTAATFKAKLSEVLGSAPPPSNP